MMNGTVVVAEGVEILEIKIPDGVLSGKVKMADGSPAEGAMVMLMREGASTIESQVMRKMGRTDEEGAYRIEGVASGKYKVNVHHESGAMQQGSVDVGDDVQAWDITMGEGFEVSGTVTFADGRPAGRAMVMAATGEDDSTVGFAMADASGAFTLQPELAAGEYTLLAYMQDYAVEARRVTIDKASTFAFELAPSGDMEVTVTDVQGKGLEGQAVELKNSAGETVVRLANNEYGGMAPWQGVFIPLTDENGVVNVPGLRPGEYTVAVKGSRNSARVTVVELEKAKVRVTP